MSNATCVLLLFGLISAPVLATWPQDATQARITALENAWNQAIWDKDAKAVDQLMGDKAQIIDYDGTLMNKAQYLLWLRQPGVNATHVESSFMKVLVHGQGAVVIGTFVEHGTKNGKPFVHRERFVDTWIDQNGSWICIASQSTEILHP